MMTKIEELKKLVPQQRFRCMESLFKKNKNFFTKNYPAVGALMRPGGAGPFNLHVEGSFLTITNTETGERCHPDVGLDRFAETLGGWTHNAWIDLIEGRTINYPDQGPYSQLPVRFQNAMINRFPGLSSRMQHRLINLPTLPSGKRFSNSVVFIGIFHGLHIDYYLKNTQIGNAFFVEPDPARFVVSCYFLDYRQLAQRFGTLLLHIGEGLPDNTIDLFLNKAKITGSVWTRILPGYASEQINALVQKVRLRWRQACDVWHPADWQLNGICNAMKNLHGGKHIFAGTTPLSPESRIAVVGAGPSLSNDLAWLKKNQDQLVIFSVHSAVSALKSSGITPDFQFSLDIHPFPPEHLERMQLDPDVPIVNTVNDIPDKFSEFKNVLMLVENGGINPVKYHHEVPFITPTTGNMALAFACWCQPDQIYLFGLDFAFKEATKTHVAESSVYQTEEDHKAMLFSGHLPVAANFSGSEVVTQTYFNLARLCAQQPIAHVASRVQVFNCSDGAKIEGATPFHSAEIQQRSYDKTVDVGLIRSMFTPLEQGVHWHPLPLRGADQLAECKKALLSEVKMTRFNWLKFTQKIDQLRDALAKVAPKKIGQHYDKRVEPYLQTAELLLTCWYRFLCFTNDAQEWQQVYDEGYVQFSSLVEEMSWPLEE